VRWIPEKVVRGVPHDTPILGYRTNTANTMRLWSAQAVESFDFGTFNTGDFFGAVADKVSSENISKILYPNDEGIQGKQLRLAQQFFFVSCSCSTSARFRARRTVRWRAASQLRHPDERHASGHLRGRADAPADRRALNGVGRGLERDAAYLSYTNHTLLPEALEQWPLACSVPCCRAIWRLWTRSTAAISRCAQKFPGDATARGAAFAHRRERAEKYVRMAHLAALGSHAINGVAALHTELLKTHVLRDFYELTPEKFSNKTNGVTPRRWMVLPIPAWPAAHGALGRAGFTISKSCAAGAAGRRPDFAANGGPSSSRTRCALGTTFRSAGHRRRPGVHVRRAGQAAA
jgi:glycogen phosphorylase